MIRSEHLDFQHVALVDPIEFHLEPDELPQVIVHLGLRRLLGDADDPFCNEPSLHINVLWLGKYLQHLVLVNRGPETLERN